MEVLCHPGLPLEYVISEPEFFEDVLANAAQLELTVMAMPVRPLPLAPLQEDLCRRLTARLDEVRSPASPSATQDARVLVCSGTACLVLLTPLPSSLCQRLASELERCAVCNDYLVCQGEPNVCARSEHPAILLAPAAV